MNHNTTYLEGVSCVLNKRKSFVFLAALCTAALLVAGTFAWTNFDSWVINVFTGAGNTGGTDGTNPDFSPGGTLHNDHCEGSTHKGVYIENWGTEPLFVRIMLSEYMEMGEGAGLLNSEQNNAVPIDPNASLDDANTWSPFTAVSINENQSPTRSDGPTAVLNEYWRWSMGGQKYFFPAPAAYRGQQPDGTDWISTGGHEAVSPHSVNRHGDAARSTLPATVVLMSQWIEMGSPIGNYWVVDDDGYSYWAAPLLPGQATGMLLNTVELINNPAEDYYYGINVAAHMATRDGEDGNNWELMLADASPQAQELLRSVVNAPTRNISIATRARVTSDYVLVRPGQELALSAFTESGAKNITWEATSATGVSFSSDDNEAILRIANDAPDGSDMVITATHTDSNISWSRNVTVRSASTIHTGADGRRFRLFDNNIFYEIFDEAPFRGNYISAGPDGIPGTADDLFNIVRVDGVWYLDLRYEYGHGWFGSTGPSGMVGFDDYVRVFLCVGDPIDPDPTTRLITENRPTRYYNSLGTEVTASPVLGRNAVVSVNKAIADTQVEDEFMITTTVRTSVDITEISVSEDAAVVLVVDVSGSMRNHMPTLRDALSNFLREYSDVVDNNARYVSLVTFTSIGRIELGWIDVSNNQNLLQALAAVSRLNSGGTTNIEGGLRLARNLLRTDAFPNGRDGLPIENASVILFSDGIANRETSAAGRAVTSYAQGTVTQVDNTPASGAVAVRLRDERSRRAAEQVANVIKNDTSFGSFNKHTATMFTIAFGNGAPTVWLRDNIATDPDFAFSAANASQLNAAFAAIYRIIESWAEAWTVTTPMGQHIEFITAISPEDIASGLLEFENNTLSWALTEDTPNSFADNVYTFTHSYRIRVNQDALALDVDYPTSGTTDLEYVMVTDDVITSEILTANFNVPVIRRVSIEP